MPEVPKKYQDPWEEQVEWLGDRVQIAQIERYFLGNTPPSGSSDEAVVFLPNDWEAYNAAEQGGASNITTGRRVDTEQLGPHLEWEVRDDGVRFAREILSLMRDRDDPEVVLVFSNSEWGAFVLGAIAGEFNLSDDEGQASGREPTQDRPD